MSLEGSMGSIQDEDAVAPTVDLDAVSLPGSVIERHRKMKKARQRRDLEDENSLPNLAGSSGDSIYLIHRDGVGEYSWRKWLVGPYCFLYMAAYITSYYAFIEYLYVRIQTDLGIDKLNQTGACEEVNTSSQAYTDQVNVQETATKWGIYFSLFSGIPSVFANVVLGSSTDKFGRKFLFFLPCIGTFIRMLVTVIGIYTDFSLPLFFVGYFVEGMCGQMFTMLLVAFTYVADITPENGKQRSFTITLIELSVGISLTIFSFGSGYFVQGYGFFYPILFSGVTIAISFVVAIFIPETFPVEKRNTRESVLDKLKVTVVFFVGRANRGRRWMYIVLMLVFLFTMFNVFARSSIEPLYQLGQPFCWSAEKIGYFAALRSATQQFIGMGLIKVLQMGLSDMSIALLGCISFMAGCIVEGLAKTTLVLYMVPVISSLGLLTIPMTRSMLSKLTREDQQGAVFAAIAAVESTINMGGSVIGNEIYSQTLTYYRGFVFFVLALNNLISGCLLLFFKFASKKASRLDVR